MKIDISPELAELIDCRVQSGEYPSASAVIEKAMALLEEQDHELRAFIQEGIDALKNGDYVEYTDENLHEFFEDIKREGRLRSAARRKRLEAAIEADGD